MDLISCVDTLDRLLKTEQSTKKTEIYLTHIEAKGLNHAELEEYFAKLDRKYSAKLHMTDFL